MNEIATLERQQENWIHYSSSPTQILMYDCYKQQNEGMFFKPNGLWITPESTEHNWFDWAMGENFRIDTLNFIHDVKFKPDAKLLRLENEADLDQFSNEYGFSMWWDTRIRRDVIYWDRITPYYDGILIPRYLYSRRLHTGSEWYYTWDCASGCIWAAKAVESITVRSTKSAVARPVPDLKVLMQMRDTVKDGV